MSNTNNGSSAGGGVGFCSLLALAFIVLKLTGVISWSWWWVLAPIWIPLAFCLVVIVYFIVCAAYTHKKDDDDE